MAGQALRVGVVGCGNISGVYLRNARRLGVLEVVACADLDAARARACAAEHGVKRTLTPEALAADPEVLCVLNLTIPNAHAAVSLAAIRAGKHVYSEKPLGLSRAQGMAIMDEAKRRGVRVGCAPDTFLGAGLQTCRSLIDSGAIGRPVAAMANMICRGHESWHPDPAFYYQIGGGPMLDMGPYYLTALVSLLGPVSHVRGLTRKTFTTRTITSKPKAGQSIDVQVPTHIVGLLEFGQSEAGAAGTITTSFDVWSSNSPLLEVHGTEASLRLPDPNGFGGPVQIWRPSKGAWENVAVTGPLTENWRGIGLADMACGIAGGRAHRASGEMALHVLDVMESINDAAASGSAVELRTTCDRPDALTSDDIQAWGIR